jgi:NADH-quinone oxidoreductase subunit J
MTLFFIFGLLSAIFVISATNPIHSVFALVALFVNSTILLFSIKADYLAVLLLVVYVGAIAILFLFVVMMLHLNLATLTSPDLFKYLPIGAILGLAFLIQSFYITELFSYQSFNQDFVNWINYIHGDILTSISIFSNHLYTTFSVFLIIASLILFVAMIGAIILTHNYTHLLPIKTQDMNNQVLRQGHIYFTRKRPMEVPHNIIRKWPTGANSCLILK